MRLPDDYTARKEVKLWDFLFNYFPKAWLAVVDVAVKGNQQHNPGESLHWARHKSTDQLNTALRHQFDYGMGVAKDTDGAYHLGKAIWRLMAQLQLDIEAEELGITTKELVKRLVAQADPGFKHGPNCGCPAMTLAAHCPFRQELV